MSKHVALVLPLLWLACQGSSSGDRTDGSSGSADGAPLGADAATADAGTLDATDAGASGARFALFVTQSPPGPQNGDRATWSGVLQFLADGAGAPLVTAPGIDKSLLADPVGLAYRASSREVFVANRHGNNAADGVAGSISRFVYDLATHALTANGTITGNGLSGVHQLAFDPQTGELFAANIVGGVSRFTFDAGGAAVPNGMIADGTTRGVAVSPDGKNLYVTTASNVVRHFALAGGAESTPFNVPAPGGLHFCRFHPRTGDLYVAALENQLIYHFTLTAAGDLVLGPNIAASSPGSVAFSPDGAEMLTSGHRNSDVIERFARGSDTWTPTANNLNAASSLGDLIVVPTN
jgi:DNA-binding beta-propeller fold protein YncE